MREKRRRLTKARNERAVRFDVFVFYPLELENIFKAALNGLGRVRIDQRDI